MDSVKGLGVAGRTIARAGKGFSCRVVDQSPFGIMTGGAGVMHLGIGRIDQRWRVAVTVAAARCFDLDQRGVIDRIRMDRVEGIDMAGGAVAARGQGLAGGQADEPTIAVMTGGAGVMHLWIERIDQRQRIIVTVAATGGAHPHQSRMVNRGRMDRIKGIGMAGLAIAAHGKGLAGGQADPVVFRIVTVRTGAVHLGIVRIHQRRRIAVAVAAACGPNLNQAVVVVQEGMHRFKVGVTGETENIGAGYAVADGLRDNRRIEVGAGIAVTEGAVGTVQGINVGLTGQGPAARLALNGRIAGVTAAAKSRDLPMVMSGGVGSGTVFMAGIAGDAGRDCIPGGVKLVRDKIAAIAIGTDSTAGMDGLALVMTCGAGNFVTGVHVVAGGPHRFPVMAGQDIAHLRSMTGNAGSIRGSGQVMIVGDSRQPMATVAGLPGKGQVRPVAVLIDTVVGDIESVGMNAGIGIVAVVVAAAGTDSAVTVLVTVNAH